MEEGEGELWRVDRTEEKVGKGDHPGGGEGEGRVESFYVGEGEGGELEEALYRQREVVCRGGADVVAGEGGDVGELAKEDGDGGGFQNFVGIVEEGEVGDAVGEGGREEGRGVRGGRSGREHVGP